MFFHIRHRFSPLLLTAAVIPTLLTPVTTYSVEAASGYENVDSTWDAASDIAEVVQYGMTPISGSYVTDGDYDIEVESSSKYFRLDSATLHVEDGTMTAEIHFDSTAYEYVYPGTPEEAAAAELDDYIACEDTGTETVFTFPVEALNQPLYCSAYSKNREKWYGRTILFDASSLPEGAVNVLLPDYDLIADALESAGEDPEALVVEAAENSGIYSGEADGTAEISSDALENTASTGSDNTVSASSAVDTDSTDASGMQTVAADEAYFDEAAADIDLEDGEYSIEADMTGGSGRATISSPMLLTVQNGKAYATVVWSSKYYDYMIVNGVKYLNESDEGSASSFTIPVLALDEPFDVIADTTAMDEPVEITYSLTFYEATTGSKSMIPQEAAKRVLIVAVIIIVLGAILNHFVQKKREG